MGRSRTLVPARCSITVSRTGSAFWLGFPARLSGSAFWQDLLFTFVNRDKNFRLPDQSFVMDTRWTIEDDYLEEHSMTFDMFARNCFSIMFRVT
ncbi:MAG: hypothetical protein HOM62_09625 [Rhodospirillaceae bacterium]|jgi:hypothetical protein|nr:hypothetical protein [Rhodospirillaceae bacterium]MBT6587388.1 hypothetical protein [Rhodospirillaceae bacterium]